MTPERHAFFNQQGYLHLQGALGKELVEPVKTHVLHELKRLQLWSNGRSLSSRLKGVPVFQQIGKIGQLIHYSGLAERLLTPGLSALMRQLAGVALAPPQDAQLLITLPQRSEWTLAGLNWHRDISQTRMASIPGIQAFVLLDHLAPHGGATLALAGSHRLRTPGLGMQGLDKLISTSGGRPFVAGGHELSLLEMTGRAGDVFLMDMRLIHTPSINASKALRLMATMRCYASQGAAE